MTDGADSRSPASGPPSAFGDVLRRVRIEAGLTQEALAERAGLSARGISDLERGVNLTPRRNTVALLTEALQPAAEDRAALAAAGRGVPRPILRSASSRPRSNLPTPLSSLVGRAADVAAVSALLARGDVRLLTLTGPGVGKTRPAVAVADDCSAAFPDGVWFVGLAALRDHDMVAAAVARTLGLPDAGDRAPSDVLAAHLRPKRLLLVLDNFEHVLPAAAPVADLLRACPGLTVLATSRAPLRVSGEHERAVAPLAVPDLRHPPDDVDLARYPAIGLFLQRAQAANSDFGSHRATPWRSRRSAPVSTACRWRSNWLRRGSRSFLRSRWRSGFAARCTC